MKSTYLFMPEHNLTSIDTGALSALYLCPNKLTAQMQKYTAINITV